MTTSETIKILNHLIGKVNQLKQLSYNNNDYHLWRREVRDILGTVFGKGSEQYKRFDIKVRFNKRSSLEEREQQMYLQALENDELILKLIIDRISLGTAYIVPVESEREEAKRLIDDELDKWTWWRRGGGSLAWSRRWLVAMRSFGPCERHWSACKRVWAES